MTKCLRAHPGDFVTLVPTCYSKALGWEFITKCLRAQPGDFVTLVPTCYSKDLGWEFVTKKASPRGFCHCFEWCSGSEALGGDPVVLERYHVF